MPARPRVVIIGAGFGGLACARALGGTEIDVTVVDRRNYHLFVPLLYQVATAALSPADIAMPIRGLLSSYRNITVLLEEVRGVDTNGRTVTLARGRAIPYDHLIIATGSAYNYFGHDDWAALAPGPRTLEDARHIRSRLLMCFERAEMTEDADTRTALLTFVIVGGGPTGVEMAGAVAELARSALACDFRNIDPRQASIVLVEAGPRLLSAFPADLAAYAHRELERIGVTVRVGQAVDRIGPEGVTVAGGLVRAGAVIWGAGVRANSVAGWVPGETDRLGRLGVTQDLSVVGCDNVYVIGDAANFDDGSGRGLPALAQVAKQQGQHLGRALRAHIRHGRPVPPFRFHNRGNTAIIGRRAAVFDFGGRWHFKGTVAWLLWAVVHIYLLNGFEKRLLVSVQWLWRYLTYQRGARLIMDVEKWPASQPVQGRDG